MRPGAYPREALTYCSNVHPGESLAAVTHVLDALLPAVRYSRGLSRMGSGLWLAHAVTEQLGDPDRRRRFREVLDRRRIVLYTLNAFPYGDFHAEHVKERVFLPDWSDSRRLEYTCQAAALLTDCLPEGEFGTISTLPLGLATLWNAQKEALAVTHLLRLGTYLDALRRRTGRSVRVCFEMEPGGVLEGTEEAVGFFTDTLYKAAAREGVPPEAITRHLGVCYDVCHQAVMFEDAAQSLGELLGTGVPVGKIQLSNALEVLTPGDAVTRRELAAYAEPRYFHQVRTRSHDGVHGVLDLPFALAGERFPTDAPWRIHFHVPLHAEELTDKLGTTQREVLAVLDFLAAHPDFRPHLEVETYTWQVLPENLRPRDDATLVKALVRELEWVERAMRERRLLAP